MLLKQLHFHGIFLFILILKNLLAVWKKTRRFFPNRDLTDKTKPSE